MPLLARGILSKTLTCGLSVWQNRHFDVYEYCRGSLKFPIHHRPHSSIVCYSVIPVYLLPPRATHLLARQALCCDVERRWPQVLKHVLVICHQFCAYSRIYPINWVKHRYNDLFTGRLQGVFGELEISPQKTYIGCCHTMRDGQL